MKAPEDPKRWPRVTLGRMMLGVVVSVPFLLPLRGDPATTLLSGLSMVLGCFVVFSYSLTRIWIAQERAKGRTLNCGEMLLLGIIGLIYASMIIVGAIVAFLFLYASIEARFGMVHSLRQTLLVVAPICLVLLSWTCIRFAALNSDDPGRESRSDGSSDRGIDTS